MTYTSERSIPLLCQTPWEHGPMVTVENHNKWYSLYLLHPSGEVEEVHHNTISGISDKYGEEMHINDNFNPKLLYIVAALFKGEVDWLSAEVVIGRWVQEIELRHCHAPEDFAK